VRLIGVGLAYFVACRVGLALAFVNPSATAIWPGTGIAIVSLLLLGYEVWPAILVGSFLVNLATTGIPLAALSISVGNTLEGLAAAYLIARYAGGRYGVERTVDILKLTGLVALISAVPGATIGLATLAAAGLVHFPGYGAVWLTWWLGNVSGALIIVPLVLHWANHPSIEWDTSRAAEAAALLVSAVSVSLVVFDRRFVSAAHNFPLEFLCTPLFIWAAFRFSPRTAAATIIPVAVIAIHGTLQGAGPFIRGSWNESLLLLQSFMSVTAVMTLVLAAEIAERRRVEARFRQLAVSDPMTGLVNYRQLVTVLDAEIRRSERMERPFAVLFLDLDGLKRINDRHGHLIGSRALMRLAEVLRLSCRSMDTAARFGGDEFALVLPETGEAAARQVGVRVCERLSSDGEEPALTVSVGVAIYPRDGETSDGLLAIADRALYAAKAGGGGQVAGDSGPVAASHPPAPLAAKRHPQHG
jgi:diguanylate cyclase (GGDEF)-like protein